MKFVLATHGWYLGGFATFCRNLATGLQQRGHRVSLLMAPDALQKLQVPPALFQQCVVVHRGMSRLSAHIVRVAQAIDGLEPDVLVLNDSAYAMAALPFIGRPIVRLPVVHSIAADEVELGISHARWWERLVAVSEFVGEAVAARGMGSRVSVCPLGVPLPGTVCHRPRPDGHQPIQLITVSRVVVHQKRIDRLPVIARLLAEQNVPFHWTVLGDGEDFPRLRQELRRLGLAGRFNLKGAVAAPAVTEALQEADVFVLTSDCEGMPQALLEAMAQGTVPVVSRIPGSTTCLVRPGECGYLCHPSAAAEFAKAIGLLARDPQLRSEMSNRASRLIAEEFSLEHFAERFLQIVAETQTQEVNRPAPLPIAAGRSTQAAFRCLGFWRNLRHQSLGQLKRWLLARVSGGLVPRWVAEREHL